MVNVVKHTIHGCYGIGIFLRLFAMTIRKQSLQMGKLFHFQSVAQNAKGLMLSKNVNFKMNSMEW